VSKGGGVWDSGPQTDKHLPQVPLQVNFLDDDILHCLLWVLSFYAVQYTHSKYIVYPIQPNSIFVQPSDFTHNVAAWTTTAFLHGIVKIYTVVYCILLHTGLYYCKCTGYIASFFGVTFCVRSYTFAKFIAGIRRYQFRSLVPIYCICFFLSFLNLSSSLITMRHCHSHIITITISTIITINCNDIRHHHHNHII
jgi:hypothetical protein